MPPTWFKFDFSVALRPKRPYLLRAIRDAEPRTATSTFTQLLSSEYNMVILQPTGNSCNHFLSRRLSMLSAAAEKTMSTVREKVPPPSPWLPVTQPLLLSHGLSMLSAAAENNVPSPRDGATITMVTGISHWLVTRSKKNNVHSLRDGATITMVTGTSPTALVTFSAGVQMSTVHEVVPPSPPWLPVTRLLLSSLTNEMAAIRDIPPPSATMITGHSATALITRTKSVLCCSRKQCPQTP